jgi:signal transduction histidine kinase/CheY-like chemotaxis protein
MEWKAALIPTSNAPNDDPAFQDAARELMEQTSRNVIYITCGAALLLQMAVGTLSGDELSMRVWATLPLLGIATYWALAMLRRHLLLAQTVWLVGLSLALAVAALLLRRTEIALLYALLPFMSTVSVGWSAGLLAWILCLACTLALTVAPAGILSPGYVLAVAGGGLFAGALGWTSSRSLYTVTEWSLQSYAEARRNMAAARQHRAQLAQVLQDLDRAYYRLERTNAALVAAWRAAAEAEHFQAELATNLSHELRTPLNLIIGFCEMMATAPHKYEGVPIPRQYRSDLNAIYQNARHLMSLVNDVLDLARIDVGRITLSRDQVDMAALTIEATAMVREYVEAKGLELRLQIEQDLPLLWLDRLRIRQVLLNLLVNAARFTEQGSIEVSVQRQGDDLRVAVRDTGRGIPEEQLSQVFQEFVRGEADEGDSAAPQGWPSTGLGLPISKRFVDLHGGRMGVESTRGAGSTFWFLLPYDQEVPEAGDEETPAQPRLTRAQPLRQVAMHKRILVAVEPEQRMLSTLQRYLEDYHVQGVSTIGEGVRLANELRAIALLAPNEDTPPELNAETLFLSCALPDMRRAAAVVGADDYLVKPISTEELWSAIEALGRPIKRVLIADDEPDMVRLLRRMLTPQVAASQCLEAFTGREALRVMARTNPDLLLLDLEMPELDGQGVLRAMKADPDLADIPVILVSAHDPDELGVRLRSSLRVTRADGLTLSEIVRSLQATLSALAPGWH